MAQMGSKSQFPVEVIHCILLNSGKYDLLNFRLVSRDWNQESLKILQKSKYRQKLRDTEISEYVEFAQKSQQFVLPFQLNILFNSASAENITTMSEQVENLFGMFGKNCILDSIVHFSNYSSIDVHLEALIELLGKISPGLETLSISAHDGISLENHENLSNNKKLMISELKKFSFSTCYGRAEQILPWLKLIEKCQRLQEIEIISCPGLFISNTGVFKNSTFPLQQIQSAKLLYATNEWIYQIIRENPTTEYFIKNLELSVDMTLSHLEPEEDWYITRVLEILLALSGSLESLRLYFTVLVSDTRVSIPFSIFPKLKNLGLFFQNDRGTFQLIEFEFNSGCFPKLESIEISPLVQLCPISPNDDATFPQVKSLTLRVTTDVLRTKDRNWSPQEKSYCEHLEKLQQIFPSISSICVQNAPEYREGKSDLEWAIKYFLDGIIQSTGAGNIQEITLMDFDHNYLGDTLHIYENPPKIILENLIGNHLGSSNVKHLFAVMTGNLESEIIEEEQMSGGKFITIIQEKKSSSHLVNKLKNVQKVKLLRTQKSIGTRTDFDISRKQERKIHLDVMHTNFPRLKEIQIDAYYFGSDFKYRTKLIQEVLAKFPDLVIDVI